MYYLKLIARLCLNIASLIHTTIMYMLCPPQCFSCKKYIKTRDFLCMVCLEQIDLIAPKLFTINKNYILTVYTLTRYNAPLRHLLFAKYRSDPTMIQKLAILTWQYSALRHLSIDYLIPIPLHWTRNWYRGFNQAEILAESLSNLSGIKTLPIINRIRRTQYQVKTEHQDRTNNVKNAFALKTNLDLTGKHIMLVDDSCTTGSTAIEAAKTLIPLNPASINMIVICRAL